MDRSPLLIHQDLDVYGPEQDPVVLTNMGNAAVPVQYSPALGFNLPMIIIGI